MAELLGTATIRVDMDTAAAAQAVRQFAVRARASLRDTERSVTSVTDELRTLRTAATNVRVNVNVTGRDEIADAAAALNQLRINATPAGNGLRSVATRSDAAAVALQAVDAAAQRASRALRTLRGRAAAAAEAISELRDSAAGAATALRGFTTRTDAAANRVSDLDDNSRALRSTMDDLGDAVGRTRDNLGELRGRIPDVADALRNTTDAAGGDGGGRAGLIGALGSIAALSGTAAAGLGAAIPVAAGLAAAVGQIAPASAVAVSGMLALQSVNATVKLGVLGLEDAFKVAFDPDKAEEFNEALEKLSPSAKRFVLAVKDAKPAFDRLQLGVQERLFRGLDKAVKGTAQLALPLLRTNLNRTADALNQAGRGAITAGKELAENGTLGKALGSATKGLQNLTDIPALAVQAIAQIGAAAGPSFERLTAAVDRSLEGVSERMTRAFATGQMQAAIERAIDLAKDLGEGLSNVGRTIANVFKAADQGGSNLITTFRDVTGALADLTATAEVQAGLKSLFQTMGTVGRTAVALFGEAVKAIAPVIAALGPPVQILVRNLGAALTPVLRAASPLLTSLAEAAGRVVAAFSPLITIAGQLLAGALRALTPFVTALADQAALLAETFMAALGPSLEQLPRIIGPFLEVGGKLLSLWVRLQNAVLEALLPAVTRLGEGFGALVRSAGDILGVFTGAADGAKDVEGALKPVIDVAGQVAYALADIVASGLERIAAWVSAHRLELLTLFNQARSGVIAFAQTVVENMPLAFAMFRQLSIVVLDSIGSIVNGAAKAFGWLPGVGDAAKAAARNFNSFSTEAKKGLDGAQKEIGKFAREAGPKLKQHKLEVDIDSWTSQIAEAKRQLSDKNLPPKKRAELEAKIEKWEANIKQAKGSMASVRGRSVTLDAKDRTKGPVRSAKGSIASVRGKSVTLDANPGPFQSAVNAIRGRVVGTAYINVESRTSGRLLGGARGGLVPSGLRPTGPLPGFQGGGPVRGPGTPTSDSIIARVSRDEFVVQAAAVRKYGVGLFEALNAMRLEVGNRAAGGGGGGGGGGMSAGRDLAMGLVAGMQGSVGAVAAQARAMAATAVDAVRAELEISSPSKKLIAIGKQVGQGFIKGLTGTKSQIASTVKSISTAITNAFKGTGSRVDDRLVKMLADGNKKLQKLASDRDKIAAKIAKAKEFAADITATAKGTGALGSIVQEDFFAPRSVEGRLKESVNSVKKFTADIQKLQKKGLSKALLRQILEMGPEQGGAFAASLAGADAATIKRYNKLQADLDKQSKKLGKIGADMLYDSGKKAGDGFLTGLKAQQKDIEKLMIDIAKGMQEAIRKALGIKSPSRVMDRLGRMTTLGLAGGLARPIPDVQRAMDRVASAIVARTPTELAAPGVSLPQLASMPPGRRAPLGTVQELHLHVHNEGVIGSQLELDNWLARSLDRLNQQRRLPAAMRRAA